MELREVIDNPLFEKDGIHFLKKHKQFSYSDGDVIENHILRVVQNSKDVSSDSRELEACIKDWPTRYHFSRERSLAYRSLNISASAKILEIGCGCGSITRLLGERAAAVVALEGSTRRAIITRERTRDLQNVQVLCASFEDVVFSKKFDIVICNGVFEYAALFVRHKKPHQRMVKILSSLIENDGSLILAIENKLGLRYFSSSKEEHTNIMFDGIEGYPTRNNGPRTYGFKELESMLCSTFSSVETLLPLPDYKLPTAIIRADLLSRTNCAEIFANTMRHDYGSYVRPRMHERLVWHELQKNGLQKEFSNSFILIAGGSPTMLCEPGWLGDIYSIHRKPEWMVQTRIHSVDDGLIRTVKSYAHSGLRKSEALPFVHRLNETPWLNGTSIHTIIVRALCQKGNMSIEERLRSPVLTWWNSIEKLDSITNHLSGAALDYNWQNTLKVNNDVMFIDGEWIWKEPIEPTWLIYRVVANFVRDETCFAHRWSKDCRRLSSYQIMKAVGCIVGVKINLFSLMRVMESEKQFQKIVKGTHVGKNRMVASVIEPIHMRQFRRLSHSIVQKLANRVRRVLRMFLYKKVF
ncbi:MAG: methyltransferase domain-containing protein [Nitrococcus mobilis]|nr:methyltransferase domain-containing protein [Nitrococcus mobilis]